MKKAPSHVVVFDIDGTFTPKKPDDLVSLVNRVNRQASLPAAVQKELEDTRNLYHVRALNGVLPADAQQEWMRDTLDLYARHGLSLPRARAVIRNIPLRSGITACLEMLRRAEIPAAVISFGVADFVDEYLRHHGIDRLIDRVYAARLREDEHGVCSGYDASSIVVPANKGEASRHFADMHGVPYGCLLAVGDSGGDMHLGHARDNRLLIACSAEEAAALARFAGETVVCDDFSPVTHWLKTKLGLT
ncbi:MAG: HAD-IB family phosphatase [Patescibacteria group bacterium]